MTDRAIPWLIGATVLALLGAASLADVEDLVRQGNAAFARGDYAKAAAYYEEAEARSTDPGLVAFNKAAALFEDGQYDEAAKHYWLCLGDAGAEAERLLRREPGAALPDRVRKAAGPRLAKVLYDLGNCELQRSKGTDGEALAWAAILYGECLRARPVDSGLRDYARHNLELARDLLVLNPPKPASRDTSREENQEPPAKKPDDQSGTERSAPGTDKNGHELEDGRDPSEKSRDGDVNARDKGKHRAGKGNLTVLPDSDELAALTPEQAAAFLRGALQRIQSEESREYDSKTSDRQSGNVLDW